MPDFFEILYVEDNPNDFRLVKTYLSDSLKTKFTLEGVSTLSSAKEILSQKRFDVVLLDLDLPDSKGLSTLSDINELCPDIPIIVISGLQDEAFILNAVKQGAQDYLLKNTLDGGVLSKAINYSVERKHNEEALLEYASVIENSFEAIIRLTPDGVITIWNGAAEKMYGLSCAEVLGKKIFDFPSQFFLHESFEDMRSMLSMIASGEKINQHETLHANVKSEEFYVSFTATPILSKQNKVHGVSLIIRDINLRKINEQHLALQYRLALTLSGHGDLEHVTYSILKILCEVLSFDFGELWLVNKEEQALRYMSCWPSADKYRKPGALNKDAFFKISQGLPGYVWSMGEPCWSCDLGDDYEGLTCYFGFPIFIENEIVGILILFSKKIINPDENFIAMFLGIGGQIGDYVKRKEYESDLLYLAYHDALTGLLNRNSVVDSINRAISLSGEGLAAFIYIDLDNFKKINDIIGHIKGDELLKQFAVKIRHFSRQDGMLARLSGDEFLMILPGMKSAKEMAFIAQGILDMLGEPFVIDGKEYYISASIGVSIYPDDGKDAVSLLSSADIAMHHVKLSGKNNYHFSLPHDKLQIRKNLKLETELHRALKNQEFVLYYQPKISIETGKIIGLEALIRWNHAGKLVSPAEFIPVSEEINLVIPINQWVLRSACNQVNQWIQKGWTSVVPVSVNISSRQFDAKFTDWVLQVLRQSRVQPNALELEITESTLMHLSQRNSSTLRELKQHGVKISIDDFGTGYSSFAYLKNFDIDIIKIDQSFIADISTGSSACAIILAIVNMAHALNMKVIAEGVETRAQLDFLKEIGCDYFQGYLFSEPLTADDVFKLLMA